MNWISVKDKLPEKMTKIYFNEAKDAMINHLQGMNDEN